MEKGNIKFFKFWFPVIVWAGLIFVGSSLPAVSTSQNYWSDFIVKKTVHFFEYFTLYILLWRALKNHFPKKYFLLAFLLLLLYAASDEFHQSFVPGREPRLRDVIIDSIGGLLALWSLKNLLPKMSAKLVNWLSG